MLKVGVTRQPAVNQVNSNEDNYKEWVCACGLCVCAWESEEQLKVFKELRFLL